MRLATGLLLFTLISAQVALAGPLDPPLEPNTVEAIYKQKKQCSDNVLSDLKSKLEIRKEYVELKPHTKNGEIQVDPGLLESNQGALDSVFSDISFQIAATQKFVLEQDLKSYSQELKQAAPLWLMGDTLACEKFRNRFAGLEYEDKYFQDKAKQGYVEIATGHKSVHYHLFELGFGYEANLYEKRFLALAGSELERTPSSNVFEAK